MAFSPSPVHGATQTLQPADRSGLFEVTRAYLLIIDGRTSRPFELPNDGEILIGREDGVALQFNASSVSRHHARLRVTPQEIFVEDMGSHNGTLVNGERIVQPLALTSGDIIAIGTVQLVLHRGISSAQSPPLGDRSLLFQRLDEDIARALSFRYPLAVLHLDLGGPVSVRDIAGLLRDKLRVIDYAGWRAPDQLVILLPGCDREDAAVRATELQQHLTDVAPAARAALALCPEDGCDRDTLLVTASKAALQMGAGRLGDVRQSVVVHQLGTEHTQQILLVDPWMVKVFELVRQLADDTIPVLITGESGCGKELVAEALHRWSKRASKPYVVQNCAALADNLIEAIFFGYERGAFTDAKESKPGLFEQADGGTLVLDEIGEMSLAAQAKLLRLIETQRTERIGSTRGPRQLNVRVVAATNRSLDQEVIAGRFRKDFYHRLGTTTIFLKPLRERPSEIAPLARAFLENACKGRGRPIPRLSEEVYELLHSHRWEGNVRELKNTMDHLAAVAREPTVERWHLPNTLLKNTRDRDLPTHPDSQEQKAGSPSAEAAESGAKYGEKPHPSRTFSPIDKEKKELEKRRMQEALAESDGVITRAARLIEMPIRTFHKRIAEYGIEAMVHTTKNSPSEGLR